jgi:hypothetical protein
MAAKDEVLAPETVAEAAQANWLFERLPEWVMDTLSNEQKEAIHEAVENPSWKRPPVNIRFTVPFFKSKFYVTVVGGEEKRNVERRAQEHHKYPLRTVANVFFFIGLGTLFYMLAVFLLAMQSAIIEF